MEEIRRLKGIECGEEAAKHFSFDEGFRNLNHGKQSSFLYKNVIDINQAHLEHTHKRFDQSFDKFKMTQKQDRTDSSAMNILSTLTTPGKRLLPT